MCCSVRLTARGADARLVSWQMRCNSRAKLFAVCLALCAHRGNVAWPGVDATGHCRLLLPALVPAQVTEWVVLLPLHAFRQA